jgi:NADPH:quinone reductase-like Zn-dependent oxidoreductase
MKALTLPDFGGLDRIVYRTDVPDPVITRPDEVRVRVIAAALNHLDLFLVGGLPGVTLTRDWVLGADGAGIVDQVGSAVTHVRPGDRVVLNPGSSCGTCEYCLDGEQPLCTKYAILGEHRPGTIADYVVLPASCAHVMPDGLSWAEAAAFPLATLTAWRMVMSRARVTLRDTVLIWGIGGGVSQAALQICRHLGCTTWVTSGDDAKLVRATALGATHVLNHRTQDVAKVIREQTKKRGMDVVIDSVGQATWKSSLGALGRRGRLVTCGGTSGPMLETDVRRLFWNQWSLLGSTMGNDAEFAAIMRELHNGRLVPIVDTVFSMADGRAAFEHLERGTQFGKVVIQVARDS